MPSSSAGGLCPRCAAGLLQATRTESLEGAESKHAFTPPTPAELAAKFPQLEILAFIGQGGMGAVYKARQKVLDREVALKILPPGIGEEPAFAERFAREAKALARLNHPGIVTIYEFGQADGLFYFLMELVEGVSLRQLIQNGRMSPREALAIVPRICDALQYAHDQGIVHRDIKPENILLDRLGRVKVADFGLAKLVAAQALTSVRSRPTGKSGEPEPGQGSGPSPASLTGAKAMGTPQYMAPEQVEHPGQVDHRADIYALGVVLYQMLTGELPGKPLEPPSQKVQLDVRLDEVVLRALEQEPERRYQHVSEVRTAVETIAQAPRLDAEPDESKAPFAALVRRYVDLVHSVAARHSANAQDAAAITEAVFIILARRGRSLPAWTMLSGWLYHTACLAAARFQRATRHQSGAGLEASAPSGLGEAPQGAVWRALAPHLDAAMCRLGRSDRDTLVLRCFEGKSAREVGLALCVAEHAAEQRVARALEKLRGRLAKRGVALTTADLAGAISANAKQAAPADLAETICATALKGSAVAASTMTLVKGTLKLMTWLKVRTAAAVAGTLLLAGGAITYTAVASGGHHKAPDLQGIWEGDIQFPGEGVEPGEGLHSRLVVRVTRNNRVYRATVDALDTALRNLPVHNIVYRYPLVRFDYGPQSSLSGTVNAEGTEVRLDGGTISGVLKRTAKPTPVLKPLAESDFAPRADSPLQGYWKGTLGTAPGSLPLSWKIAGQKDGTYRAELDNPMQGANGQPVSVVYNPPAVELRVKSGSGMFRGTINSNDTELAGSWVQGGGSTPSVFKRADYQAERAAEPAKDFSYTSPADVRGHWKGTVTVGDKKLRMTLDVASLPDGSFWAAIASTDSLGNNDPTSTTDFQFTPPKVHGKWKWAGLGLDGELSNGKLAASVRVSSLGGAAIPLALERSP